MEYTILERLTDEGTEVLMVPTADIYSFVHLSTAEDNAYIYNTKTGELSVTDEGFAYPSNYFDGGDERLVVKVKDNSHLLGAGLEQMSIEDDYGDMEDYLDVTDLWMSYIGGKAVDIEHGINTDTIEFDVEYGDVSPYAWHSVAEVDAEWEVEHYQDYPRQEATVIYTCSNGRKIRETSPFFSDDFRNTYEYID